MPRKLDRRGFFRKVAGEQTPRRPPWTAEEAIFTNSCNGCGACIRECPQAILVPGAGGLPWVDFFRGGCTFCGGCVERCATGALAGGPPAQGWNLRADISTACLETRGTTCRVCEAACEEAALCFLAVPGGRARVIVLADRCTGCGACVSACPAKAVVMIEPVAKSQVKETAA